MKLSDLDSTLSEAGLLRKAGRAIGQAAASTGLLGKDQFAVASARSEKKRQEKEKAGIEKTANYTFQKLFYSELESGLESAVQNGLVKIVDAAPTAPTAPTTPTPTPTTPTPTTPTPTPTKRPPVNQRTRLQRNRLRGNVKESYADFNLVLESKILNESSISDYITQFVAKETRNLAASPEHTASVKTIADQIQADITNQVKAGKIANGANFDISGNAAFKSGVKQLADLITAWPKQSGGSQSQATVDVNNNNVPDSTEREEYKKNLLTMLANIDFNDKNSSQVLLGLVNSLMGFIKSSQK
jgi:hypothetical protein